MFKSLKCMMKGHLFLDSRSQTGVQVCVRCRLRRPFEGLEASSEDAPADRPLGLHR